MRILYFDCPAGLSGDMTLGALLDLGLDEGAFRAELDKLDMREEYVLDISKGKKSGISGTAVRVLLQHHHHEPGKEADAHEHEHEHEHEHAHEHHHRGLRDIVALIERSALSGGVKKKAVSMFAELAAAEGRVHGIPPEEVHFHEVGAVDSIVDIVGACICMESVNADRIVFSPLNTGSGRVKCAHGLMPVPAPATAELLAGVPCYSDGTMSELTTPTGALIARCFADAYGPLPSMTVDKAGYGLGFKDFEFPNAARAILGHTGSEEAQAVCILECNIDDMSGQAAGYALEKLFGAGALDAFFTPIFMKKNRPAYMISAICSMENRVAIERVLLAETTTLGVRVHEASRVTLPRRVEAVETPWGSVRVKVAEGPEGSKIAPEYEDCRKAAAASGRPFNDVYAQAQSLARQKLL
jgi:pyridinium-3,5-bisthiocarboxylic acid mononucleotide nickel chelatase